ncbi:MAG: creatininase family protein [Desulfobacula sp.]|nr:creatininase family protein [Desulfobacula sp.]
MRIEDMTWEMVEELVKSEKRAVLPLGSTEQHGKLSLAVDYILAQKVAQDAAQPLGIPVYPALPYGVAPYFAAYPGTVTLRMETYLRVVEDILNNMYRSGHRKILIVNGHGGNSFVGGFAQEWLMTHEDALVKLHNWWAAPKTWKTVQDEEKGSSHASWMENFPWTKIASAEYNTDQPKKPVDLELLRQLGPGGARKLAQDGNFGGREKNDTEFMLKMWDTAVKETRSILEDGWADEYL